MIRMFRLFPTLMKLKIYTSITLLLISMMLVTACIAHEPSVTKTMPTPKLKAVVSPSPIPSLTAPVSPTAVLGENTEERYVEQILINLKEAKSDTCLSKSRAEIWVSEYLYSSIRPLLQDPNIDYLYPSWSPTGEWLAYISSSPIEVTDPTAVPEKAGTDSIWIMHANGSDQKKVSEDIPSLLIRSSVDNSCFEQSKISIPPTWSLDGKFIIFAQAAWDGSTSKLIYNYYIIDIDSGKSKFLLSQNLGVAPIWTADLVVIGGEGVINLIKGSDINQLTIIKVPYPSDIPPQSEPFISAMGNDEDLAVSFRVGSTLISPIPKEISVWKLNTVSEEWEQLTIIERESWAIPNMSDETATLCEETAITILDSHSWKTMEQVTAEELGTEWINCGLLKPVRSDADSTVVAFIQDTENKLGIGTLIMHADKHEIKTLIDLTIFSQIPKGMHILDFSLKAGT